MSSTNNDVGGLFKEFGNNEGIREHIVNGVEQNQNNPEIIQTILEDNGIMERLATFVSNPITIADKLKVFIGQQIKKLTTTSEKPAKKENVYVEIVDTSTGEEDPDESSAEPEVKPLVPPLTDKPVWLYAGCYVERLETNSHLVTPTNEYFY